MQFERRKYYDSSTFHAMEGLLGTAISGDGSDKTEQSVVWSDRKGTTVFILMTRWRERKYLIKVQ